MMNIKKNLIRFSILFLLPLALSGCHKPKKTATFQVPESFDENKNYEITFWAKNDTNVTQADVYRKAISDFEKLYPNITVNFKLYTDYGKIYNDVITNISTNTTPNVCITYPDHIATYLTGNGNVVPLDELLKDPRYGFGGSEVKFDSPDYDEIIPEFLNEGVLFDHNYAIPFMRSTEALYINETYVNKLGYEIPDVVTWDFIFEVSEKAMEQDAEGNFKINGQKVLIPFIYKSTDNMMIQMLNQLGAGYSDPDGNIKIFNDDTKKILLDLSKEVKKGTFSTFKISGYPANFLNAGQCIFAVDSTAGSTWMGSDAPLLDISEENIVRFKTVVRPVPQYDAGNISMISQGPSICIFNKDDAGEVLASWLFAEFLLTDDIQIGYATTEGYVPVTTKARNNKEYHNYLKLAGFDNKEHYDIKIDATTLLLNNTDKTFTTAVFNGSASLRDAAGQLIESVTKSVRRKKTVDDAFIDNLYKETISLYHLDSLNKGFTEDLGPLPKASKVLITILITTWLIIGFVYLLRLIRNRQKKRV
jgi:multiple sugar transport system substrate-binding protein